MPLHPLGDPFLVPFLKARQVPLIGATIDTDTQEKMCAALLFLNNQDPTKRITLLIDSSGGSVTALDIILDTMRVIKAPVDGLVTGGAASSAFRLLQHCRLRMAYRHAVLSMHGYIIRNYRVDGPSSGKDLRETKREFRQVLNYFAKRTGQPVNQWKEWCAKEHRFTSLEAKRLNLIDKVV
jgi:ATP-dependent Clp protease protease subunit